MTEKSTAAHAEGARVNVNVGASAAEKPAQPATNTWAKAMPIVYILSGLGGGGAAQLAIGARVVPSPVAVASAGSDEIKDLKHTLEKFMRTTQEVHTVDARERADLCAQLKAIKGDLDEIIKLHPRRR